MQSSRTNFSLVLGRGVEGLSDLLYIAKFSQQTHHMI